MGGGGHWSRCQETERNIVPNFSVLRSSSSTLDPWGLSVTTIATNLIAYELMARALKAGDSSTNPRFATPQLCDLR